MNNNLINWVLYLLQKKKKQKWNLFGFKSDPLFPEPDTRVLRLNLFGINMKRIRNTGLNNFQENCSNNTTNEPVSGSSSIIAGQVGQPCILIQTTDPAVYLKYDKYFFLQNWVLFKWIFFIY